MQYDPIQTRLDLLGKRMPSVIASMVLSYLMDDIYSRYVFIARSRRTGEHDFVEVKYSLKGEIQSINVKTIYSYNAFLPAVKRLLENPETFKEYADKWTVNYKQTFNFDVKTSPYKETHMFSLFKFHQYLHNSFQRDQKEKERMQMYEGSVMIGRRVSQPKRYDDDVFEHNYYYIDSSGNFQTETFLPCTCEVKDDFIRQEIPRGPKTVAANFFWNFNGSFNLILNGENFDGCRGLLTSLESMMARLNIEFRLNLAAEAIAIGNVKFIKTT